MTHICYTLEETANRLNLSETVLVRLSQYFKVPRSAYEEVGYLSFKGDLAFTDQDIAFFKQVKERLLAGENLDEVKSRIRANQPLPSVPIQSAPEPAPRLQTAARHHSPPPVSEAPRHAAAAPPPSQPTTRQTAQASPAAKSAIPRHPSQQPAGERASAQIPPNLNPIGISGLREVQSPQTFQQAAERSFERYKSQHRTGLSKVFEKMLKDVGATSAKSKSATYGTSTNNIPKSRASRAGGNRPADEGGLETAPPNPFQGEFNWDQLIAQASRQPRSLNANLKNAAQLLKAKALAQPEAFQNPLG